MVWNIGKDIRDLKRLEKILEILVEEGWGYYVKRTSLKEHLPLKKRLTIPLPIATKKRQARSLRIAFERLGPTFIKLGQLLSLRPDLVPKEFADEFSKLQDEVPPFSFSRAKKIIEGELNKPLNELFKKFERKPLASASIAQVHKAVLKSGKTVAVKVQRPKVKDVLDTDIDILFFVARSLEKHFPRTRKYQPSEVVKEFALWTRKELDFKIEAMNALRLKEAMSNNPRVIVPNVYNNFSSKRVLTLDFVEGIKLDDIATIKKQKLSCKKIAMDSFLAILEQALIYGFFHGDPHPANLFVNKKGKLIYLDFGIMGELSVSERRKIIKFILSIPDKDADKSLDIILSLAKDKSEANIENFKAETLPILSEVYHNSIGKKSIGRALYQVIGVGARNGIIFNANHVLTAKAIYQGEGAGLELDPDFKVSEGLEKFRDLYLKRSLNPLKLMQDFKNTVIKNRDLLLEFPEHLVKIIKRLEQEPVQQDHFEKHFHELEEKIEEVNHRKNLLYGIIVLFFFLLVLLYLESKNIFLGFSFSSVILAVTIITFIYLLFLTRKITFRGD